MPNCAERGRHGVRQRPQHRAGALQTPDDQADEQRAARDAERDRRAAGQREGHEPDQQTEPETEEQAEGLMSVAPRSESPR